MMEQKEQIQAKETSKYGSNTTFHVPSLLKSLSARGKNFIKSLVL